MTSSFGRLNRFLMAGVLGILCALALPGDGLAVLHNYAATLDGLQPVPPTGSPGTGTGTFVVDDVANTVSYVIEFSGLLGTEVAAHIHGMAPPGTNAGVVHGLPLGSPKVGVWNYAEAQEADILAGLTYVNIHSTLFGGGEIRGQVEQSEAEGCRLNCPAGDGGIVNMDGSGNHSPDLDGNGEVAVVDFALFATAFGTADVCSDFDCSGDVSIVDFALFATHFLHGPGPAGVCD